MSLLEWIWGGIVSRVRALIDSAVSTLKSWVLGLVSTLSSALDSLRGAWDGFRTKTLPDLWAAIRNAGQTIWQTITNVYNNVSNYVTNTYNTTNQYITNVTNNVTQNVTQILGATREWVDDRIRMAVPSGFSSNPRKFIQDHAEDRYRLLLDEAIESFWLGFEEGLSEEEGHVSHG